MFQFFYLTYDPDISGDEVKSCGDLLIDKSKTCI